MGVTATTRLPAGWYPDPDGDERRRWWDGQEWTQYTAEFQRDTSVDDLNLEPQVTTTKPSRPAKGNKSAKADRKLRRVETEDAVPVESASPVRASAERLGRWLAGARHFGPSVKKRRRHRKAR